MDTSKTREFIQHIIKQKEKGKNIKVYNWYNKDNLGNIVTDGKVFWIELTWSRATLPNYVLLYIKRWMKKQGYTYLYDMPMRKF